MHIDRLWIAFVLDTAFSTSALMQDEKAPDSGSLAAAEPAADVPKASKSDTKESVAGTELDIGNRE